MTSRGKGGRSTKTVTSIVSDCKFYCFHCDRGGREGGVEMVIFAVKSFLNSPDIFGQSVMVASQRGEYFFEFPVVFFHVR